MTTLGLWDPLSDNFRLLDDCNFQVGIVLLDILLSHKKYGILILRVL